MDGTVLQWILSVSASAITALLGFLLGKKKYNNEVDNGIIENMEKSLEFYKKLSDDKDMRIEQVLQENAQLRKEVASLRDTVNEFNKKLATYGLTKLLEEADGEAEIKINKNGKEEKK